jgi:Holliday junction resolvase RusA-like endonuclease
MRRVEFTVHGIPAPQGSKKAYVVRGRAVVTDASKKLAPWRNTVADGAREAAAGVMFDDAVHVSIVFNMPRPKTVRRTFHTVAPDVDKLIRAVLDGLTVGGLIRDDSLVVSVRARKRYSDVTGAEVVVKEYEP